MKKMMHSLSLNTSDINPHEMKAYDTKYVSKHTEHETYCNKSIYTLHSKVNTSPKNETTWDNHKNEEMNFNFLYHGPQIPNKSSQMDTFTDPLIKFTKNKFPHTSTMENINTSYSTTNMSTTGNLPSLLQTFLNTPSPDTNAISRPCVYTNTLPSPIISSLQMENRREAFIRMKTTLKLKYYRNGRRNLQCFPVCKAFGDYSSIKPEDFRQHDIMWGKCRGTVTAEITLPKGNLSFNDIIVLARVHSIKSFPNTFEEIALRECLLSRVYTPQELLKMKTDWILGKQVQEMNQNWNTGSPRIQNFNFSPRVWKYENGIRRGRNKKSHVQHYIQFEVFAPHKTNEGKMFICIGSGLSTPFEVGSCRVLARQKKKESDNEPALSISQEWNYDTALTSNQYSETIPSTNYMSTECTMWNS